MTGKEADPVAIIGAGPAGMTLAIILKTHGVPCVVFDRRSKDIIHQTGRAGLFDHTAAMIVDQYQMSERIHSEKYLAPPLGRHASCYFSRVERDGRKTLLECSPVKIIEQDLREKGLKLEEQLYNPLYPQTELVLDMHNKAEAMGVDLRFNCHVEDVAGFEPGSQGPLQITYRQTGQTGQTGQEGQEGQEGQAAESEKLQASFVVGCAGYHDPVRKAMQQKAPQHYKEHKVDWGPITLGIFADSVPSTDKIIYGFHPDGMAAHMIRTKFVSRYYLEVGLGEDAGAEALSHKDQVARLEKVWTDDKIWSTLKTRLGIPDLDTGRITSRAFFRTQHYIVESMNVGRACVAGDAAHSTTYLGARGGNNAVQDAYVLAELLVKAFQKPGFANADLAEYSRRRVPTNWESIRFTYEYYRMCFGHHGGGKDEFQHAMARPLFDNLKAAMEAVNDGESSDIKPIDFLTRWFCYCYVQPCERPKSIHEWIDMQQAGFGVRKVKSQ